MMRERCKKLLNVVMAGVLLFGILGTGAEVVSAAVKHAYYGSMTVYYNNPITDSDTALSKSSSSTKSASISSVSGASNSVHISAYLSYSPSSGSYKPATNGITFDSNVYKTTSYLSGMTDKKIYYITAKVPVDSQNTTTTFKYGVTP